ncbi:MAG: S8 family serine peptidase, partial [Rhodospirillaceae bacterium]|nr:S8 family serine peptidase [Rhodospirillaceae bacterium]
MSTETRSKLLSGLPDGFLWPDFGPSHAATAARLAGFGTWAGDSWDALAFQASDALAPGLAGGAAALAAPDQDAVGALDGGDDAWVDTAPADSIPPDAVPVAAGFTAQPATILSYGAAVADDAGTWHGSVAATAVAVRWGDDGAPRPLGVLSVFKAGLAEADSAPWQGDGAAGKPAAAVAVSAVGSDTPVYLIGEFADADTSVSPLTNTSGPLINIDDFRADPDFAGIDGSGFATVILDTGIDLNHPFFGADANGDGVADRIVYQYDFANGDANASDVHGHGSNVASIVASENATYKGMAPGADIIALKVFTDAGAGYFSYIENALRWVVNNAVAYNIASVNMSLGDSRNYSSSVQLYGLADELAALANLGVIVVSASGNSFYEFNSVMGVSYPAADPNSLSVGAVYDSNSGGWSYGSGAVAYSSGADVITPFSQRDDQLTDIFAPGAPITGASATGGTVTMHGTSQAAPHIAGIAVLAQQLAVQELGRKLTVTEFKDLLNSTGVTIVDGDDENDNVANTGLSFKRVDVKALGDAIKAMGGPDLPTLSAANITVTEGNSGSANAVFTVTLSEAADAAVTVDYATVAGGTATAGADYTSVSGTLTIAAGATSGSILLPVLGDTVSEGSETVTLRLSNVSGAELAGGGSTLSVTATILDNDPVVSIAAASADKDEGDTGTTAFTFTVTRLGGAAAAFTVGYVVTGSGGSPADAADFGGSLPGGTLSFAANEMSKTLTIQVSGDTDYDPDEAFTVTLVNPTGGAAIATASATGTIRNDDPGPGPDLVEGTNGSDLLYG